MFCMQLYPITGFTPYSKAALQAAIEECLKLSPTHCSDGAFGTIGSWDVSGVSDMGLLFPAPMFNGDLSKWDVSRVTNMNGMFYSASKFSQTLCGAWAPSAATKDQMFDGSFGKIGPSCASMTTLIGSPFS